METRNRHHAARPSLFTPADRARMARNVPSPRRDTDRLVNAALVFVSAVAILVGVMP